jgi:hypothetical protein
MSDSRAALLVNVITPDDESSLAFNMPHESRKSKRFQELRRIDAPPYTLTLTPIEAHGL